MYSIQLKKHPKFALEVLECNTVGNDGSLHYLMKTSFFADISECKNPLSVKRVARSSFKYHCCLNQKEDFNLNKSVTNRRLVQSLNLFMEYRNESAIVQQNMSEQIIHLILLALCYFSLIGFHDSVYVYALFRFGPVRCVFYGLPQLPNGCLFNYSSDPNKAHFLL